MGVAIFVNGPTGWKDQFGCKNLLLIIKHCKYSEEFENCLDKKFIMEMHNGGYVSRLCSQ